MGCSSAFAHPGHADGLAAGAAHPLTGIDHILAMLAMGLWAGQTGGRALWALPCAFLAAMCGGGLLGISGIHLPLVEGGIAASVLALGLMIAFAWKAPSAVGVMLATVFALFHGYAHGAEMTAGASALTYCAGFLFSTALLHAGGLGFALMVKNAASERLVRVSGVAIALCAVPMFAGMVG